MRRKAGRPLDFSNLDVLKDPEHAALYTSLSRKENPRLDTLTKVLDPAGLRLTVTTA